MNSRNTLLLFLALLLVYSSRAASAIWVPSGAQKAEMALVNFAELPEGPCITVNLPLYKPVIKSINGKEYMIPLIEGAHPSLQYGCPDLPVITSLVQLTAEGSVSFELIKGTYEEQSNIEIAPSEGSVVKAPGTYVPWFGDEYLQDDFFPSSLLEQPMPFISRNKRYQAIHINPIQYNPVTKVLRVYSSMEFRLIFKENNGLNPMLAGDLLISPMPGMHLEALNSATIAHEKSGLGVSATGRMLVICPEEYKTTLQPLLDWKLKCGIVSEVVDPTAFTDALQLKAFIKSSYYSYTDLSYVLLVGDDDKVPTYALPYGSSDNTYAYIAGNDHYPDLLVGRFSVSTVNELKSMVDKTLEYETNPSGDNNWLSNATGIASTMSPGDDGESDFQHVRTLLNELREFSYDEAREFFDGTQGGLDNADDPATADILSAINQGTGFIIYAGHGSTSTWATGKVTRSAIGTLNNTGKYPVIISAACETGNFAGASCLAESWMRVGADQEKPSGAVACLMASGTQTSYPPMEGQDEMIKQITSIGNGNSSRSFGSIAVAGMGRMNSIYGDAGNVITDTWILFGDPSLQIRTKQPAAIEIKHDAFIGYHRTSFSIHTIAGPGTVTLTRNGILLGKAELQSAETIILLDQPVEVDSVMLTVTAFNSLPYSILIPVTKQPEPVCNLTPRNHSERIPVAVNFGWDSKSGGLPAHYRFYLGTDNPPANILAGIQIEQNHYMPEMHLQYDQTYYWRVDAINDEGTATGKVMEFRTIYGPDEDFESWIGKNAGWTSAGNSNWIPEQVNVFNGLQSLRSGLVQQGDSSILLYSCLAEDCDFIGFWSKVSIQENDARFIFRMDGNILSTQTRSQDWTYHSFGVDPGNHTFEWIYIHEGQLVNNDEGAWLDDINLPVHHVMATSLAPGTAVCEGQSIVPQAWAENYNSIQWETDGDGTFDDNAHLLAAYTPGINDLVKGVVKLKMITSGFDHCQQRTDEINIYPAAAPVINLPEDTVVVQGTTMVLDAGGSGIVDYLWLPDNSNAPVIHVDSVGSERGTKTLTLRVTNEAGCFSEKTMRIYFPDENMQPELSVYPNPCQGSFFLESELGATRLTTVKLLTQSGQEVWNANGDIEIIDKKGFDLNELPPATYFLVTGNHTGTQVLPLVIHK